jgi:uncharacterized ubiquitin-like protein YukD
MPNLTVNLVMPDGKTTLEGTRFPDSRTTDEIVGQLITLLGLERFADGKAIEYSLRSKDGTPLNDGQTLRALGVQDGDVLKLVSSAPQPQGEHSPLPQPPATDDKLEIFLRLLDLNKEEKLTLRNDQTVEELIRQIVKKYGLNDKDEEGNQIKYFMKSRSLGLTLDHNKTLSEISVPRLDRLVIYRREIAGAKP